jgi:uncharacterized lipoprotein NlpE involved in copper resistance
MKKYFLILMISFALVLIGCSNEKNDDEVREMIEVDLQVPEKAEPNQEIEIYAKVTQGKEIVDDAYEVKFEIWKSGDDNHEMIDSKHTKDGIYPITYQFKEEGLYYVVSHVTARGMHNMPKKEIIVGQPEQVHEDSDNHSHHEKLTFEFETDGNLKANEAITLKTTIMDHHEPIVNAKVTFEVWKNDEEKHEYIDTKENDNGMYTATFTPSSAGTYSINIHIVKGELHDHHKETITISE